MPGMEHVALPENMAVTSISAFVQMNLGMDSQEVRISNKHGCSWGEFGCWVIEWEFLYNIQDELLRNEIENLRCLICRNLRKCDLNVI